MLFARRYYDHHMMMHKGLIFSMYCILSQYESVLTYCIGSLQPPAYNCVLNRYNYFKMARVVNVPLVDFVMYFSL